MLQTNRDKLPIISVGGEVFHPRVVSPYRTDASGFGHIVPATGGIVYNIQIGDSAMGWIADHIEPGVTIRNDKDKANIALNMYACIGNTARVTLGAAKGETGYVTGTHGGVHHVMVYFPREVLEKLSLGDHIQIQACGQGLQILDHPDISVMNIGPDLLEKIPLRTQDGKLQVPIARKAPAHMMGSGIGTATACLGDYDIMTTDKEELKKWKLDQLRLGDLVLLENCDNTYGRAYLQGAVSVGVVIHGDSYKMGHGPGVTVIMTSKTGEIEGVIDENANIANYLGVTKAEG